MYPRVIGINHHTASLDRVARLQFNGDFDGANAFLKRFVDQGLCREAFFLQTCNRREFFFAFTDQAASERFTVETLLHSLSRELGCAFDAKGTFSLGGRDAMLHMFSVASSLDSMVLGETEITKQVKIQSCKAFETGVAGKYIHSWVDEALRAAKRVRTETAITRNVISMASLACRFTRDHNQGEAPKTIVFVGAGHYMKSVMPHFSKFSETRFVFANRTPSTELADQYGGESWSLAQLKANPPQFDVMLTATASSEPLFQRTWFEHHCDDRPVLILDMALPRDVGPGVAELTNVNLISLGEMETILEKNRGARENEIPKAQPIFETCLARLDGRWTEFDLAAIHREIAAHYRHTSHRAVDFLLKELPQDLSDQHADQLRDWAEGLASRLVNVPILGLRGVVETYGTTAVDAYTQRVAKATPLFKNGDRASL